MRDTTSPETLLDAIIAELGGYSAASPDDVAAKIVASRSKSLTMYVLKLGVRARMSALRYRPRKGNNRAPEPAISKRIATLAAQMGDILNNWTLSNGVTLARATRPMLRAEAEAQADNARVLDAIADRLPDDETEAGSLMSSQDVLALGT